ncbi:unnamed protein product [Cuscuta campestris]|uniref:Uncharacterized protein n=1 Tax=Cuscuta campestris TaxID=132261 RepID=A0A484N9V7_9ASTE|nr:unnamed protein product [Cuscuta campestris]
MHPGRGEQNYCGEENRPDRPGETGPRIMMHPPVEEPETQEPEAPFLTNEGEQYFIHPQPNATDGVNPEGPNATDGVNPEGEANMEGREQGNINYSPGFVRRGLFHGRGRRGGCVLYCRMGNVWRAENQSKN